MTELKLNYTPATIKEKLVLATADSWPQQEFICTDWLALHAEVERVHLDYGLLALDVKSTEKMLDERLARIAELELQLDEFVKWNDKIVEFKSEKKRLHARIAELERAYDMGGAMLEAAKEHIAIQDARIAELEAAAKMRINDWYSCTVPGAAGEDCPDPKDVAALRAALTKEPTDAEREAQRRSFAFGNQKIHKPDTTRADVDRAAERLAEQEPTDAK